MTQKGTHQSTIFHDIQALLDMSQCSYNSHISILCFGNLRLRDQRDL